MSARDSAARRSNKVTPLRWEDSLRLRPPAPRCEECDQHPFEPCPRCEANVKLIRGELPRNDETLAQRYPHDHPLRIMARRARETFEELAARV